jgi:hypothetical protein
MVDKKTRQKLDFEIDRSCKSLTNFDKNEANATTGNGNYVTRLKLVFKKFAKRHA